jgi:hypothetical protein
MCGPVRLWSANGDCRQFTQLAVRMAGRNWHRGTHDSGTSLDEEAVLALSILDDKHLPAGYSAVIRATGIERVMRISPA